MPWMRPLSDRRFMLLVWTILGIVGWAGLLLLARELLSMTPPKAGFDLELLLEAGRRVADGQSPYDQALIAGATVQAESLFYSYPPPVAQVMALVGWLPSNAVLAAWALGATAGLALVAAGLGRHFDRLSGRSHPTIDLVLPTLAIAPFVFPFAVALLFGNLDAWFPLAYGTILLGVLSSERSGWAGSGVIAGLIGAAKLHPASLGVWFLARGWRQRRDASPDGSGLPLGWLAAGAAIATTAGIVVVSLALGGLAPWQDYLDVVRAGAGAELVDQRNIGPAAQVAALVGGSEGLARLLQVAVTLAALALTVWAAVTRRDPVESLAWATIASLVTLPVTWFHDPVALIPFAIAAWARARGTAAGPATARLLSVAIVVTVFAIFLPVAIWIAVSAVLAAVRRSGAAAPAATAPAVTAPAATTVGPPRP
jgi:hypothetical protein